MSRRRGGERLGTRESFTGGFVVDPTPAGGVRRMFGPFEVDQGRTALMRSASAVEVTDLIASPAWREIAVALLENGPNAVFEPMMERLEAHLCASAGSLENPVRQLPAV